MNNYGSNMQYGTTPLMDTQQPIGYPQAQQIQYPAQPVQQAPTQQPYDLIQQYLENSTVDSDSDYSPQKRRHGGDSDDEDEDDNPVHYYSIVIIIMLAVIIYYVYKIRKEISGVYEE